MNVLSSWRAETLAETLHGPPAKATDEGYEHKNGSTDRATHLRLRGFHNLVHNHHQICQRGGGVYVGATQDELPTTNFPTPSPGHHMT
jgi:hypothetical protein